MKNINYNLIQSYVKEMFFVSTIWRASSAPILPTLWYFETIVWEWDSKTRERGKMIHQQDSGYSETTALINHFELCRKLMANNGMYSDLAGLPVKE